MKGCPKEKERKENDTIKWLGEVVLAHKTKLLYKIPMRLFAALGSYMVQPHFLNCSRLFTEWTTIVEGGSSANAFYTLGFPFRGSSALHNTPISSFQYCFALHSLPKQTSKQKACMSENLSLAF